MKLRNDTVRLLFDSDLLSIDESSCVKEERFDGLRPGCFALAAMDFGETWESFLAP